MGHLYPGSLVCSNFSLTPAAWSSVKGVVSQGEVSRGIIDLIGGLADWLRQGVSGPSPTSAWGSQGSGSVSSVVAPSAGVAILLGEKCVL